MKSPATLSTSRDSVLARMLDDYLVSCEAGAPLSADDLARRFPELASDVADCLASLDFIRRAAASASGGGSVSPAVDFIAQASEVSTDSGTAPLRQLGDFRILREVGRGGMGVVYEAEQISLARRVALKVFPFASTLDPRHLQRFRNEALAAASLHHPHIISVHAVGCERGVHFYAMQFIDGCTLADVIADLKQRPRNSARRASALLESAILDPAPKTENQRSPAAEAKPIADLLTNVSGSRGPQFYRRATELIASAADALEHAHNLGIVHRDIKPANLLLDQSGKICVGDFGLARFGPEAGLTMTGDILGTLRYMAPEQALAKHGLIDHRADIYALGATLYELLTLQPVVAGVERAEILRKIAFDDPAPLRKFHKGIPPELETITLKCLAKAPLDRYATAADLAQDLRRFLENKPIKARRPGPLAVCQKWAARHAPLVALAAAALLALTFTLALSAGLLWTERGHTQAALQTAENNLQVAKIQQRRAESFSEDVRLRLYAADMRLAFQAWNSADLKQTVELLDRYDPTANQHDLRGFEWHYLWRLCHDERLILSGHEREVHWVAYSPDGQRLVTAGADKTARVWNAVDGQNLLVLHGHAGALRFAMYSPTGEWIATASDDKTIKLWDAASGALLRTLTGHTGELRALAFSPDGRWLASGSLDDTAQLWDVESGQPLAVFRGHTRGVRSIAFSPDGKTLATAAGVHLIKLWDVATREERATLSGNLTWACGVAFSPDGKTLANCAWGPAIKLWDAATGREILELSEHTNSVNSVAYHPDGKSLLSASRDSTVRLWEFPSGEQKKILRASSDNVACAAFSPDMRTIATTGTDGRVKLWDADAQQPFVRLPVDWPAQRDPVGGLYLLSASFSPAGRRLAYFTSHDRELRILDLSTGDLSKTAFLDGDSLAFRCMEISPDGRSVATGTRDGLVQIWDLPGGAERFSLVGHTTFVHSLAFSPDSRLLASGEALPGGIRATVRVWQVATGQPLYVLECHANGVRDLAFSPDGQLLAAADDDQGKASVWRMADGQRHCELIGHTGNIGTIRFAPSGNLIASGADDYTVRLWDATTGQPRFTMLGHAGNVGSLVFSPDGNTLASGSHDRTIRLWHCLISFISDNGTDGETVSYINQVVPILQLKCVECHSPGNVGSWSMTSHAKVKSMSAMIEEVILSRRMPPWDADPYVGKFENHAALKIVEARTLLRWIHQGAPRGEGPDPLPTLATGPAKDWPLGTPDIVLRLPDTEQIPATGVLEYRHIELAVGNTESVWVRGAWVKPGNKRVVHHAIAWLKDDDEKMGLDEREHFAGYAPGSTQGWYPQGTGKFLPKQARLDIEMHYTPDGATTTDQTEIGLYLAPAGLAPKLLDTLWIYNPDFKIQPGDSDSQHHAVYAFKQDATLYDLMPHMHLRGSWMNFELLLPSGQRETLLSVPRYDFNWQRTYALAKPKQIPAGSWLLITGSYDNSPLNPANPNPKKTIRWGQQSFDEMFLGIVNVTWSGTAPR